MADFSRFSEKMHSTPSFLTSGLKTNQDIQTTVMSFTYLMSSDAT